MELVRRGAGLRPGLSVDQICCRDIGKSLRGAHVVRSQLPRLLPVEVERTETTVLGSKREREDRPQTGFERPRSKQRKATFGRKIRDRNRSPRLERGHARA